MNYKPINICKPLSKELKDVLNVIRSRARFDSTWVDKKTKALNKYFTQNNVECLVVAISGGIDSAVVASLVSECSKEEYSNIKKIFLVSLCSFNSSGVTGQDVAYELSFELYESLKNSIIEFVSIPMSDIVYNFNNNTLSYSSKIKTDQDWSSGQTVSYLRQAMLYSFVSKVSCKHGKTLLVGTTNKSEGASIGYFGKAADGMVDIQPISDLLKSQVYKVANQLNVPISIMARQPTGDMWNGLSDEEVFGFSYDALEIYHQLNLLTKVEINRFCNSNEWINILTNIKNLEKFNDHKYFVGSPAVHFDILERGSNYKWKTNQDSINYQTNLPKPTITEHDFEFGFVNKYNYKICKQSPVTDSYVFNNENITVVNIYSQYEVDDLLCLKIVSDNLDLNYLTDNQGIQVPTNDIINHDVNSIRCRYYSETLAKNLQSIIIDNTSTVFGCPTPSKINPLFRFIEYLNKDSKLVPHYDSSYQLSDKLLGTHSVIIFLTAGTTVFIEDNRSSNKLLHDWLDFDETIYSGKKKIINCEAGDVMIFPHHLMHYSPSNQAGKTIIRTDLYQHKFFFGKALS